MNGPLLESRIFVIAAICSILLPLRSSPAQQAPEGLDRVMTLSGVERELPADRGSAGLRQQLRKLGTTASVLHVVAHPDDEHGGVLTKLSRGEGARVAQLTLTRGEGGANAIGSELFDGLGLVRTEELLLAAAYYGLDDLYFTPLIDYGFSKTLDEAFRNWGRENVLRDVVRVIRINRPFVLHARFHGSERDGHGHHQAAGVIAQEAFRAAGDPERFPEQIEEEGLRPWQPLKLYRGGIRDDEPSNVEIDAGTYSPWLGHSYRNMASRGLSYQRSQTSGAYRESWGPYVRAYELVGAVVESPDEEASLFDGIDTSLPGLLTTLDAPASPEAVSLLREVQGHVEDAVRAFEGEHPAAVVPSLATGLQKLRQAMEHAAGQPDVEFHLRIKEVQFMEAINTALGLRLQALGVPADAPASDSPWSPQPTMGVAVPGQTLRVAATLLNPSGQAVQPGALRLEASPQWEGDAAAGSRPTTIRREEVGRDLLSENEYVDVDLDVTVPEDADVSDRYYYRESIADSRYSVRDSAYLHLPHAAPVLTAVVDYEVEGVPVTLRQTVRRREANFPFGYETRELKIAPVVAVNVQPATRIVPTGGGQQTFDMHVELVNNRSGQLGGELQLETPPGWRVEPAEQSFSFSQAGERRSYAFQVVIPQLENRDYTVEAVALADGTEYRQGYDVISHRDNETQYLYRPAAMQVRGVDVEIAPDLQVGYVMGVGDEVPGGIEQLGADVQLLTTEDLATADLSGYDAIVVGTRAYAVRQDIWTYNQRLLDFAKNGGHLVVLYQTPEFIPGQAAPYPAELPRSAEEVSEEDAPVQILAEDHPVFNEPNDITAADFEGWVEQRGSKFFSEWDDAYAPMIETQDQGQEPQRGGWLIAEYGEGYYTYFAYAVHRQLPYAVPGAYRIFANLLSLGQ